MADLRTIALALPNVEQGIACAGTALESRTYRTSKKTFLFVSKKEARLVLDSSASQARKLGFEVGANGWVKLPLDALPAAAIAKRWVAESYALARGRAATATKAGLAATTKKRR